MAWWLLGVAMAADGLTGSWTLAEPREVVAARIEAAVEGAVEPFNFAIRAIARPRLVAASTVCAAYSLGLTDSTFSVGCDGAGSIAARLDGTPTASTSPDGRSFTLSATREGEGVRYHFTGAEGWQRVVYLPDGGGLKVTKTVHSAQLDRDVTWDMRYARRAE